LDRKVYNEAKYLKKAEALKRKRPRDFGGIGLDMQQLERSMEKGHKLNKVRTIFKN